MQHPLNLVSKEQVAPGAAITLSVSMIADGQFYPPGSEVPFTAETLPEHLKPYLSSEEEAPAWPEERILSFEPNTTYLLHPDGSRSHNRAISRQAAALAADAFLQAQAEEEAEAANELPPETAAALEAAHDTAIGIALKAAEIADRDKNAAIAAQGEGAGGAEEKPPAIYVKRGGAWMHAERARLRASETVFQKEPSGAWAAVGVVDANGGLPEVTIL